MPGIFAAGCVPEFFLCFCSLSLCLFPFRVVCIAKVGMEIYQNVKHLFSANFERLLFQLMLVAVFVTAAKCPVYFGMNVSSFLSKNILLPSSSPR